MQENTRRVIGIDPASGKKSYVFAPGEYDDYYSAEQLRNLVHDQLNKPSCLICWDAPLTGPPDPDADDPGNMTMRQIESRKGSENEYHTTVAKWVTNNPGVALRPFSGLSHWVISRNVLGLPRVGRFDAQFDALPLYPVFEKDELSKHQWAVTEVHPTLAVYLWLHEPTDEKEPNWRQYKGKSKEADVVDAVQAMWEILHDRFLYNTKIQLSEPTSDDAFDARVAWLLGYLWLHGDAVELVGNEQDGTFLLPRGDATSN
jgi:hypothetical protein